MARAPDLEMLRHVASLTGISGRASTSTSAVAGTLGISQQSASRRIRILSASGHLLANPTPRGIDVELTERGKTELQKQLTKLQSIFAAERNRARERKLTGVVESGLGEGRYYVAQQNYNRQFRAFLQGPVYPGTLNIKVQEPELQKFLTGTREHTINGFTTEERSFGALRCYAVKVNSKLNAALVLPERSTHGSGTAELVAKEYLRKEFKLRDGNKVLVTADEN